jgi:hypothetical protein
MESPAGSNEMARFFKLAELRGCICDLPHKRQSLRDKRVEDNENIPVDGTIV